MSVSTFQSRSVTPSIPNGKALRLVRLGPALSTALFIWSPLRSALTEFLEEGKLTALLGRISAFHNSGNFNAFTSENIRSEIHVLASGSLIRLQATAF
jgi:hypothetical protein